MTRCCNTIISHNIEDEFSSYETILVENVPNGPEEE